MNRSEQVVQACLKARFGRITLTQLELKLELPPKPILRVMDALVSEGLTAVEKEGFKHHPVSGRPSRNPVWKIVDREGLKKRKETKRRPGPVRDRIWKAIRISRIFQKRDIEKLSGQAFSACDDYICVLVRNGYARNTGRDKRGAFYQLIKDPGPKRPMISDIPDE